MAGAIPVYVNNWENIGGEELRLVFETNPQLAAEATVQIIRDVLDGNVNIDMLMRLQATLSTSTLIRQIQNARLDAENLRVLLAAFLIYTRGLAQYLQRNMDTVTTKLALFLFGRYAIEPINSEGISNAINSYLTNSTSLRPNTLAEKLDKSVVRVKPTIKVKKIVEACRRETKCAVKATEQFNAALEKAETISMPRRDVSSRCVADNIANSVAITFDHQRFISMELAYRSILSPGATTSSS